MRLDILPLICCPDCGEALEVLAPVHLAADGHVMEGEMDCVGCRHRFAIREGVPRLGPREVAPIAAETATRFADEWTHWSDLRDYYERQFLGWVAPLGRDDFRCKLVLEGGCGKGRHTALAADFGAEAVVALDLGPSALVAFAHTRHLPNVHVVIGDLMRPPVRRRVFDLAFSVGVIHHLPDPSAGFARLASCVREGGRVAVWVYGLENNEWIARLVSPARRLVTARLPPGVLRKATALPSLALWAAMKLFYRPRSDGRGPRGLPYGDYLASMHHFPFDEIHSIVFDQLVTPVAHYLPGEEVRRWFASGFSEFSLRWHNRYSWTGVGTVGDSPDPAGPAPRADLLLRSGEETERNGITGSGEHRD